jgi:hypothetical protein
MTESNARAEDVAALVAWATAHAPTTAYQAGSVQARQVLHLHGLYTEALAKIRKLEGAQDQVSFNSTIETSPSSG